MPKLQKNDLLTLTVEDFNNLGHGVAHLKNGDGSRGMTVFVTGGVPGDVLEARIIKCNKQYLVAKTECIKTPSPWREGGSPCAAKGCGGCIYRAIGYDREKQLKEDYVRSAFRKAGLPSVTVEPVRSTDELCHYRNKAQYPVRNGKNGMEAGFFASGTHRVVPAAFCQLQPPVFEKILNTVCAFCDEKQIRAYNEEDGSGILRHVYLRMGAVSGEVMVCLVVNAQSLPFENELAERLHTEFEQIKSILINPNTKNTNVVLGKDFRLIFGREWIEDTLCSLKFRISAGSFYQVNHDACELLYGIAKEQTMLTGKETLLDLYCGIGTIGLSMAERAERVVGIEIVEEAVACAQKNAEINGITNARFFCGDASDASKLLAGAEEAEGAFDPTSTTVILDPPRKGSTRELIEYLCARGFERVVYVSCNPDTLARDCAVFAELGYTIGTVTPVDMFPRTGHVESVVCLKRQIQQ
ncbi:MAG: 23S rRNA (uracil(1939)-C(5))-methyltransferase RlmD [Clostridia bacterium]|nr:23S rRNA (uracil(1939)-C(5))-methyltransferase RlmD [Clostridia bacterium]